MVLFKCQSYYKIIATSKRQSSNRATEEFRYEKSNRCYHRYHCTCWLCKPQSIRYSAIERVEVPEFAPAEEKEQAKDLFLIGYNSAGFDYFIKENKEEVYRRMWNLCNGNYEIVSTENTNLDLANFKSCTDISCSPSYGAVQHTTVIKFRCK